MKSPMVQILTVSAIVAVLSFAGCTSNHGAGSSTSTAGSDELEDVVVTGENSGSADRNERVARVTVAEAIRARKLQERQVQQQMPAADFYSNALPMMMRSPHQPEPVNRENYAHVEENSLKIAALEPVSTFSVDVDSGAYANVRRFLMNEQLPPRDAVRIEEMLNYFSYDYPVPDDKTIPFSVTTELATTPWNPQTWLLQVGLKGYEIPPAQRPAANLVFLLDVSGSMNSRDKLPLLKKSFGLLTRQLTAQDRISVVVYAGASGIVLDPTAGNDSRKIKAALRRLHAGGSTNGADGIRLAYELAGEAFIDGGINRVILATDGDFNVGTVNFEQLKDLVERKRETGISLTTLGFGTGNYNDHLMEQLADAGNGNYAYIDSLSEARKVLVHEVSSTLMTIAKDVKIQLEFNPAVIAEYRLIGYENRVLNREDFRNDKVDAGEIGAGHTVTALYELTPVNSGARLTEALRYGHETIATSHAQNEIAFLRLRFKQPNATVSEQITQAINTAQVSDINRSSTNLRMAAAVAAFGQTLKGSVYTGDFGFNEIAALAKTATGQDPHGYRREFLELVELADDMQDQHAGVAGNNNPIAVSNQ